MDGSSECRSSISARPRPRFDLAQAPHYLVGTAAAFDDLIEIKGAAASTCYQATPIVESRRI